MRVDNQTFEELVNLYYASLYRFALSLTHREDEACDLTQETFNRFATKGHQIRDEGKAKGWLFSTLYRQFLETTRWQKRFPHVEVGQVTNELPPALSASADQTDAGLAREAMLRIDDIYRVPLTLFYLEDHSYREIAEILDIPLGTVMSRLSRGRDLLCQLLGETQSRVRPVRSLKLEGTS